MKKQVEKAKPAPVVSYTPKGEKRVQDEFYERLLENGHKWGFPEPKVKPYVPPPPAKEEPEVKTPWWKNFCDPRGLISVRGCDSAPQP